MSKAMGTITMIIFECCRAWLVLHVIDALLRRRGFMRVFTWVARQSPHPNTDDAIGTPGALRSLAFARRWHLYRTTNDCLPVALTAVYLLRRAGNRPRLVLGVTKYPFSAHAWVRVDDRVVDFPSDKHLSFTPIELVAP